MFHLERELIFDYWRRGRWWFVAMFAVAATILLLVFGALRAEGAYDPATIEAVQLHVTFLLVAGVCVITAAFSAQGKMARFFPRPINTARLVVCQLSCGMGSVAAMYLGLAGLLNFGVGANWPLWGPAIFLATAFACMQATVWWTESWQWALVLACGVVTMLLAIWFSRCYGATIFGDWQFMWTDPTLAELGTLAALTIGAYLAAIAGVSRNRCGEGFDFASLAAWCASFLPGFPARREKFRSAFAAQLWFEWRQKLGGAPALLGLVIVVNITLRLIGITTSQEMLEAMFLIPLIVLLILPLPYGLVVGNCGGSRGIVNMTPFLATRPCSDASLATVALITGGLSLLLAWGIWVLGLAAGAALSVKLEGAIEMANWGTPPLGWWLYIYVSLFAIAILVASWAHLGLVISITMSGRPLLLGAILGSVWFCTVVSMMFTKDLAPVTQAQWRQIALTVGGLALLSASVGIAAWTWRRQLVPERTIWLAATGWVGLTTVGVSTCIALGQAQYGWLLQIAGLGALAMLPFLSAPLALSWNRHR